MRAGYYTSIVSREREREREKRPRDHVPCGLSKSHAKALHHVPACLGGRGGVCVIRSTMKTTLEVVLNLAGGGRSASAIAGKYIPRGFGHSLCWLPRWPMCT